MDVPEHPPIMTNNTTSFPILVRRDEFPGVVSDIENFSVVIAHGLLQPSASSTALDPLFILNVQLEKRGKESVWSGFS